jgi:hypothetical protein
MQITKKRFSRRQAAAWKLLEAHPDRATATG